jgi:hypothetical protein
MSKGIGDHNLHRSMREDKLHDATKYKNELIKKMSRYRTDTIRRINQGASQSGLDAQDIYSKLLSDKSEIHVREEFTYPELTRAEYSEVVWDHVRQSLRVKDTSLYPDKESASAVYKATLAARKNRREEMRIHSVTSERLDSYRKQENNPETARPQMTSPLADLITQYPERVEDIIDYISSRCNNLPTEVDTEALKEYLTTPARSLSEGSL